MIVYDIRYFDGRGRQLAGFDRDTVLPATVQAPYAIAVAKTGEQRTLCWAGGRWHERRPHGIPASVRLAPRIELQVRLAEPVWYSPRTGEIRRTAGAATTSPSVLTELRWGAQILAAVSGHPPYTHLLRHEDADGNSAYYLAELA